MTRKKNRKLRPVEDVLGRLRRLGMTPHSYEPDPIDPGNGRMARCCTQASWHEVHRPDVVAAFLDAAAARQAALAAIPDITEPLHPQQLALGASS